MVERYLHGLRLDDPGAEEPSLTRERLRDRFPRGATRRMTQLGLLVGATLLDLGPSEEDTVVYASGYAETRALEAYLESFPTASPTLFQTSIHPSGVQQAVIGKQQPIRTLLPLTGSRHLVSQALTAALLAPASRVLVCGGEERGTWLLDQRAASDRTFAFAFALTAEPSAALARLRLDSADTRAAAEPLSLAAFVDALAARRDLAIVTPNASRLSLAWL
jgi:hypothetical protein